jgi:hypothetical protein
MLRDYRLVCRIARFLSDSLRDGDRKLACSRECRDITKRRARVSCESSAVQLFVKSITVSYTIRMSHNVIRFEPICEEREGEFDHSWPQVLQRGFPREISRGNPNLVWIRIRLARESRRGRA